jgi:hypothetical protein
MEVIGLLNEEIKTASLQAQTKEPCIAATSLASSVKDGIQGLAVRNEVVCGKTEVL